MVEGPHHSKRVGFVEAVSRWRRMPTIAGGDMKVVTVKIATALVALLTFSANAHSQVTANYANSQIKNESGHPVGLIAIANSEGKKVAELFITGKEARFDSHQRLVKGAGFIQAEPNEFTTILFVYRCKFEGIDPCLMELMLSVKRNRVGRQWQDHKYFRRQPSGQDLNGRELQNHIQRS